MPLKIIKLYIHFIFIKQKATLIFSIFSKDEIKLDGYVYPKICHYLGFSLGILILLPLPIYFIKHITDKQSKFGIKNIRLWLCPDPDWQPAVLKRSTSVRRFSQEFELETIRNKNKNRY